MILPPAGGSGTLSAQALRYEHRVVVATTSLDRELDVEESLARNVNQFAALGFEVGAIVGGDGRLVDQLLDRKPYTAGLVDHGGHVFVIMSRPIGRPALPREYRFLHARTAFGVDKIVAGYGAEGFRLTVTAYEGGYFHAAFERGAEPAGLEYRVYRNAGRKGWDARFLEDAAARGRATRLVPITLDSGLVELGAAQGAPADFAWETDKTHQRPRLEARLKARAEQGFRVQLVRMRGTDLDVALLKPAGWDGRVVQPDLDDGPWGMPCGRGAIAGADIFTDGDVYCVAEDPQGPIVNRGFDFVIRPESSASNLLMFGRPSCEVRARLATARSAATRIARAMQLENELNRKVEPGYRVTRAFVGAPEGNDARLVVFTSLLPAPPAGTTAGTTRRAPRLEPELDEVGQQLLSRREDEMNDQLTSELASPDVNAWVEIYDGRSGRYVLLSGCATHRVDKERAETIVRRLLVRTPYADYRVRNEIIVDLWR